MTSVLNVDEIAAKDGTSAVTLTKQSAAKAWIYAASGLASINGSFNVSSLGDDGTGDGTVNVTNSFSGSTYSAVGTCAAGSSTEVVAFDTDSSSASNWTFETAGANSTTDRTNRDRRTYSTAHGDLA
jgi:hypothetical protein